MVVVRGTRQPNEAPRPITGKWTLNATGDSLLVAEGENTRHMAVTELSATTLRLSYVESAGNGTPPSTYTTEYSH